ncbi:hypothetical protein V6N13_006244 [Hibiscus sabdariffa]
MLNNKGDIYLSKLSDHFGKLKSDDLSEDLNLVFHIRADVLHIIRSVVALSSSSTNSTLYLALLKDVETIKSYAWGVAMLAHLYWILDMIKIGILVFPGISTLIRGPIIPPEFIEEVNGRPREFLLMVESHQKMVIPLKDSRNAFNESTFTDYFDKLSKDHMIFQELLQHKSMGLRM